jgi:hypothetical protein
LSPSRCASDEIDEKDEEWMIWRNPWTWPWVIWIGERVVPLSMESESDQMSFGRPSPVYPEMIDRLGQPIFHKTYLYQASFIT